MPVRLYLMNIRAIIQLIRPVNLLLLAATMYAIDVFILEPNFNTYGILFTLNAFHFFLLVLSTVLICAGGYVINDYFDVQIDAVNKPEKQIIGKKVTAAQAFNLYMVLSFTGLALGAYLSIKVDYWKLVTIHVVAMAILYFYSASFKKTPLLGNFLVALLAALSVIIIIPFEPHLYKLARPGDYYIAGLCTHFILGIAAFAFTLTMVREIVKDMEDVRGDRQFNARTIAVAWGMQTARIFALFFILVTLLAFGYLYNNILDHQFKAFLIYLVLMSAFLIFIGIRIAMAQTALQCKRISTLLKLAMLLGLSLLPLYFILQF